MFKYRVKETAWQDFVNNPLKYNFHKVGVIYEYIEDYLNGKLWIYNDRDLAATHYLDNVDGRTKIIKKLLALELIEKIIV